MGVECVIPAMGVVFVLLLTLSGCRLTPAQQRGKQVYETYCAKCHNAKNLELRKQPPRLAGLFRRSTLPSGAPATDAEVRDVIVHGRATMPAFDQLLSPEDVDGVVKFLHTLK